MGRDNNILTQIGLVVLIGLAAKNAISLLSSPNATRRKKIEQRRRGGTSRSTRLRPILMTSMASSWELFR